MIIVSSKKFMALNFVNSAIVFSAAKNIIVNVMFGYFIFFMLFLCLYFVKQF